MLAEPMIHDGDVIVIAYHAGHKLPDVFFPQKYGWLARLSLDLVWRSHTLSKAGEGLVYFSLVTSRKFLWKLRLVTLVQNLWLFHTSAEEYERP